MPAAPPVPTPIARRALLALAILAALLGTSLVAAGMTRAGTSHLVEIENFAFGPPTLSIDVGDTVTWTNRDVVEHTATSTTGAFDSGMLAQGQNFSLTFNAAGTYEYLCTPHPFMTGRINVNAAVATPPPPAPSSGTTTGSGELSNLATTIPDTDDLRMPAGIALLVLAVLMAAAPSGLRRLRS
mgnify:CR=1 FL=1